MIAGWTPGIGDPTTLGWLTVVNYCAACLFALVALRFDNRNRTYWAICAVVMGFLAINKELDLQALITASGREVAKAEGWYQNRQVLQIAFILVLASALTALTVILLKTRIVRGQGASISSAGVALLSLFILVRAASFHKVDHLLGLGHAGVGLNHLFENAGIVIFWSGAAIAARRRRVADQSRTIDE